MLRISVAVQHLVGFAMKPKNVALVSAACTYVGLGYLTFQVAYAISGDSGVANWVAAGLSLPLSAPLLYAIGWIEKHL